MEKYWLYLQPYLVVSKNKENIVLTNILSGESFIYPNCSDIDNILNELLKKGNKYCVDIDEDTLEKRSINNFLVFLREKFLADWLSIKNYPEKPIIMSPDLILQKEVKRVINNKENSLGENIMSNLTELNFYIDSKKGKRNSKEEYYQFLAPGGINENTNELTYNIIKDILGQVKSSAISLINILSNTLFDHSEVNKIVKLLNSLPIRKHYHIQASFIDKYKLDLILLNSINSTLNVHIINSKDYESIEKSLKIVEKSNIQYSLVFAITSEFDYQNVENITSKNNVDTYEVKPLYYGENIAFFEKHIFLNKEDILLSDIKKKDYFMNQVLNSNEFGKLTIFCNGDVYANINHPKLGNINNDSIYSILIKEMTEGTSWRMIRDKEPCNQCIFQWLCPSPSNYELVFDKSSLCHVDLDCFKVQKEYSEVE